MTHQTAEIIDLKSYRERKAERRPAADNSADVFHHDGGLSPFPSFAMPVAFLVFWPTWVFTPQPVSVWNKGGSGVA